MDGVSRIRTRNEPHLQFIFQTCLRKAFVSQYPLQSVYCKRFGFCDGASKKIALYSRSTVGSHYNVERTPREERVRFNNTVA